MMVRLLLFTVAFIATTLYSTKTWSQCQVTAPNDVSITCGASTTLTASTSFVVYGVTSTSCSPVLITGTNAFPTTCDDCVTGQIPIGFNFNFYGNTYSSCVIQSNGIVGFGSFTYTGYSSFAIPASGNPNNYIAGLYADIDIRYGGSITYQMVGTAPNRRFVVSYNNVVPYNGGSAGTGTASFQIILNENGSFHTVVSQFSSNWNASTSGALATQGAENSDGTYAFPVLGRNASDWRGITPGNQDCHLFNPIPCIFQRWQDAGGNTLTTNTSLTVSPTGTTDYTAVWNCGGNTCTDNTLVTVNQATFTIDSRAHNTSCLSPNGSITFTTPGLANGTYSMNYTDNGVAQTATITVSGGSFTLNGLDAGTYTNFVIENGICDYTCNESRNVNNPTSSMTLMSQTNSNACPNNGSIVFGTSGFANGSYTLNYNLNGTPTSTSVSVASNAFTMSNLGAGTFSNFSLVQGICSGTVAGPITITAPTAPTTTSVSICQGETGSLVASSCGTVGTTISQGSTFNSGSLATSDPTFVRSVSGTTYSSSSTVYYDVFQFTASTSGSYTFNMCTPGANWDGFASLYHTNFNPASPATNFIIADDDGNSTGNCEDDSRITTTLTAGTTYFLVTCSFSSGTTGNYEWSFTGPAGATLNGGGAGASNEWYTAAVGGTSISSATTFNPVGVAGSGLSNTNTPGTFTFYAACSNAPACRTAATFTINGNSTAPTSVSGTGTFCPGNNVTLTATGGTLASGANYEWFTGSCGGTLVGTGNSIVVNPNSTTVYYVRASANGTCLPTSCASGTVTMPTPDNTVSNNNQSATCVVNSNNYVHFYHSSGKLIASINSHGQNLGNVTVTSYVEAAPVVVLACSSPALTEAKTAMERHWVVTPQFQPASPVDVYLHFRNAEYTTLNTAANSNLNPNDNTTTIGDLKLSKYSGPNNVDNLFSNNCTSNGGNGGVTIHTQTGFNSITNLFPSFVANGRYVQFQVPNFSELWLHGDLNSSPLPVELANFQITCTESGRKVTWSTSSEINASHYELQSSMDFYQWETEAIVEAKGNSITLNSYETMLNSSKREAYYRLIQVDNNGEQHILTETYQACAIANEDNMIVFPNPSNGDFQVQIETKENLDQAQLILMDMSGKIIHNQTVDIQVGISSHFFREDLSIGTYMIQVKHPKSIFKPVKISIQ